MHPIKQVKCAAYARVSTLLGQDPENQMVPIRQFAEARSFELATEYIDKGISGAKESRPALDQMVKDARLGKFKVVIIAGIDRIGRNTRHLLNLIHELNGYGVAIISLRENLDFSTPVGQATLTILGAISQLERELIRERIKSALAAKRITAEKTGSGWRCGRPTLLNEEIKEQIVGLRRGGLSIRAIERAIQRKVSRTSITRVLKEAGLAAEGGTKHGGI